MNLFVIFSGWFTGLPLCSGTNVSVNSKPDHPPGRPQGIRTFSLPGGRVFDQLSLPGVGF